MSRAKFPRYYFALALAVSAALGGCKNFGDMTGSLSDKTTKALPSDEAGLQAYADKWERIYARNPGEKVASINYARGLRALTRFKEGVAVMQKAAVKAPKDMEVLGEFGKALADAGQLQQARDVLSRSYTPDRPNWDFMSARGSVADRLDDHLGAQDFYRDALKIRPEEPSILSNLGLSYALSQRLDAAEETLRHAADLPRADSRVRQNLALVLALEGKFAEAERISQRDMSAADAARNVRTIRDMIAQNDTWRTLQAGEGKASPPKPGKSG